MSKKYISPKDQPRIDVLSILADPHPYHGEDYAIHLWYRSHGHNPRFTVSEKSMGEDCETATLVVNGSRYEINIRTAKIIELKKIK